MNNLTKIPIIWEDKKIPGSVFSPKEYEVLDHFAQRFNQRLPIRNIEVHVDLANNAAQKIKFYQLKLHVQLKNGKLLFSTVQTKNIVRGLRDTINLIKHEAEKYEKHKNKQPH